ncbi:hypothetical protein Tco_1072176 [Tanacetum coccineum]
MSKNTQEALTNIENKSKVRTCRIKPQVSSSGGSSIQNDAITALTKQVEALISSMQEAYNRNQKASIYLMQNQMGQIAEAFQERPSCVPSSDTETYPQKERKAVTTMSGLTLDGSFIPHSNFLVYQDEELEPETITKVVEIASSQSTPLIPHPETPPLSKEDLEPNPHQPLIPYSYRFKKEKIQALKNPTGRVDHFVYRIDIVNSLCNKFPIENNSMSGNPTSSSDYVVESPSTSLIPYEDSDSLVEETDTLLSYFNDSSPEYETFSFDIEKKSSGNSFIFDLSIDPFPPADRSVSHHEEFADELAHIISPSEYDRFYFDLEIVPGDFTRVLEENIFDLSTKGLTINELNDSSLLLSDCDSSLSKEFSKIDLLVSFPSGNEDIIFDPGIFTINGVHSKRFSILLLDDFSSILLVRDFLFLTDPSEIETFFHFLLEMKTKFSIPGSS